MKAVGIKTLKDRLSEYVRLAAAGETVLVLDREQVVAEINPPSEFRRRTVAEEWKADLIRKGLLIPAIDEQRTPPANVPLAPLAQLLDELDQDRADRGGRQPPPGGRAPEAAEPSHPGEAAGERSLRSRRTAGATSR